MPYNPQVQDISGQLLAQGMMQRAQSISGLVGDFMKMEDERQKTTGALKGFLSDPYYQQQVNSNPELAGFAQKVQKGSASLGDVRQFLGTMTAMQSAREQQQKADQMEAQRQYNDALRQQALSNKMAIDAATAERTRQNQIANQISASIKEFQDLEGIEKGGGTLTSQQSDRLETLRDNPFLVTARQGMSAGLDPISAIKLGQSQEAMDTKAAYNDLVLQMRAMEAENRRAKAEAEAARAPRLAAGSTREFTIGDKKIGAEWDGKEWVDTQTGAPIYVAREVRDPAGNVVIERGAPNPFVFKAYGIPIESATPKNPVVPVAPPPPKTTDKPGGTDTQPKPENMELVAPPMPQFAPGEKPAAKTLAIFDNEEQARQALERGEIMPGQTITIGGRRVMVKLSTK